MWWASSALANDAEIVSLVGKGEAKDVNAADWRPAAVKQKLRGGSFVRTGDLSQMALLMQDQTQLRLNQNSMLQIKEVAASGAPTRLDLKAGRAWMQSKGLAANVVIDTPNATAAIRGTEWELEVDPAGKTLLAVFSGSVAFSNAQGSVLVGRNEAALAEAGKAPVKVVLTSPRDRIQWVNALSVDTRRYAEAARASPAVQSAIAAIDAGDLAAARSLLQAERGRGTRATAVLALLADIELVSGETARAIALTREALALAPRDPDLLAQLARAQLIADQVDEAKRTIALPRDADNAAILVATGETARREGNAPEALTAFERATLAAPADDRGWFALGRAQGEREDATPARRNLHKSLELNPAGAGYQGELGTVEAFANRFDEAGIAFDAALKSNPSDYVAHTGLGLLRLKQGDPEAALESFLRAGVLEPRYARSRTFTAVAYYQLGRHADAIAAFRQAAELDDKDPLPYLYLTQVYTDLFRAGEAVDASREALKRLPYLKSLNQIANNQQGTGNFGYALAFFGLESWALEIAQRSYNPHTASSHLFLADRYEGQYNRNSELFQGFLTDPTAFGGSNRFATLTPRPGGYGTIGDTYSRGTDHQSNPYLRLNGLFDWQVRSAYFVDAETATGTTSSVSNAPDGTAINVTGDRRAELYAIGLGSLLTENLGVFAYGTRILDKVVFRDYSGTIGDEGKDRIDAGARYRFSPTSMTWLKFGRTNEAHLFENYTVFNPDLSGASGGNSHFRSRPDDFELRHSMDLTPADHVAFGAEYARDRRTSSFQQVGVIATPTGYIGFGTEVDQDAALKSRQAYASYSRDVAPGLMVQGDVFWQRFEQQIKEDRITILQFGGVTTPGFQSFRGGAKKDEWNPRIGFAWTPGKLGVRAAWQRWTQPVSTSTLAPVATAGLALDDRLVTSGGKATRAIVLFNAELGERTHMSAFYDNEKVENLGQLGYRIPVPNIQFVELLRNAQLVNVANGTLLEGTPDFDSGRAESAGLSFNHMLSSEWSIAARYVYTRNRATLYARDDAGNIVVASDKAEIPLLPRNLATVGFTWASPWRIYLSAQAVYRSDRFTDRDNTPNARLKADTTGSLAVFWETADKSLILGAGANNIGSKAFKESYVFDARYRF
jgi:tetratricopeptide (TPR) repeat protein